MERFVKNIKPFKNRNTEISLTFTDKIKIDNKKQKTALMPNLIHSLDSTVLFLLYNSFYTHTETNTRTNFYSVHDCYGVSAKYVENLITLLKTIYIDLYAETGYIKDFDQDIIKLIINTYGVHNTTYDPDARIIKINNNKSVRLPNISNLLECKDKPL
jgi:DNA-directed RNA polymerase